MSKKIITLQIGQCGNSIGLEFWKTLSTEHGIGPDGVLKEPENTLEDRKDVFFYSADDGRYIPRAILIDLEPRVISGIRKSELSDFFNPENIFIGSQGSGAGNVWGTGYAEGEANYEVFSEMVRREVEVADALEGFIFTHSISGGTGSGLGSFLIEKLSDEYKKATTISYSVFPGATDKDVVVAPYNSVLTLKRLTNNCDAVVVLDNTALANITNPKTPGGISKKKEEDELGDGFTTKRNASSFREMNMLVSNVMAATTATLRFPSYSNNDLVSLLAPLVPTPKCHFLMTGYTPITLPSIRQYIQKTSVIEVMNRLLDQKNIMVSTEMSNGLYMSILNILQGEIDPTEIHSALRQIHENQKLRFIPWGPASIQLALSRKSPYVAMPNRVSGLMLANHTNIVKLFKRIIDDYKGLIKTDAYLNEFTKTNASVLGSNPKTELEDSCNVVMSMIEEYQRAEKEDFLTA